MDKKTQAKLSASLEADESLDRMYDKLNEGWTGGRVTKGDLTSWAILYFEKNSFSKCIEKIRKDHFSKTAHLTSVLQQLKRGEFEEHELYARLAPVFEKPKQAASAGAVDVALSTEEKKAGA